MRAQADEFLRSDAPTPESREAEQRARALLAYLQPLEPLLTDPSVMEICMNRPGEVFAESLQGGTAVWKRHDLPALDFSYCRRLARLIGTYAMKDTDLAHPILSAALPGGERVEVALPPAVRAGEIAMTLRKTSISRHSMAELEAGGVLRAAVHLPVRASTEQNLQSYLAPARPGSHGADALKIGSADRRLLCLLAADQTVEFLDFAVKQRKNILVAGRTQSGKTTLMKALIGQIPAEERLITIEDVHELALPARANKLHLFFARPGSVGPTATQLLQSCVRHRPDRILPGELRGEEAWTYIQALNTGHPGSLSTVHANGAREAFRRVADLVKDSARGAHLETRYILDSLYSALDVVLYVEERKLKEIYFDPNYKLNLVV